MEHWATTQEQLPELKAVCLHQHGAGLPHVHCWEADGLSSALCATTAMGCLAFEQQGRAVWKQQLRLMFLQLPGGSSCEVSRRGTRIMKLGYQKKLPLLSLPTPYQCLSQRLKTALPILCPFYFFFLSSKIYAHSQMPNKEYSSFKNVILALTLLHA